LYKQEPQLATTSEKSTGDTIVLGLFF